jgi:hypothetical protein
MTDAIAQARAEGRAEGIREAALGLTPANAQDESSIGTIEGISWSRLR